MFGKNGIIVCGLNGAGKSTLGKMLAGELGYHFIDIENLYFPNSNAPYPYDYERSYEEVVELLGNITAEHPDYVLASVKGSYGERVRDSIGYAVYIDVPKEIRLQRVKQRSFDKFGERMCVGGDLYEKEKEFYRFAEARDENTVASRLKTLSCPILKIDGTQPVKKNVDVIVKWLGMAND